MEVIAPARRQQRPAFLPTVGGTVIGTIAIVLGVVIGWVALATPILANAIPTGHPEPFEVAVAIGILAFALVAPAALVLFGANRLVKVLGIARGRVVKPGALITVAAADVHTVDADGGETLCATALVTLRNVRLTPA